METIVDSWTSDQSKEPDTEMTSIVNEHNVAETIANSKETKTKTKSRRKSCGGYNLTEREENSRQNFKSYFAGINSQLQNVPWYHKWD